MQLLVAIFQVSVTAKHETRRGPVFLRDLTEARKASFSWSPSNNQSIMWKRYLHGSKLQGVGQIPRSSTPIKLTSAALYGLRHIGQLGSTCTSSKVWPRKRNASRTFLVTPKSAHSEDERIMTPRYLETDRSAL